MNEERGLIYWGDHFKRFYKANDQKSRSKIDKVLFLVANAKFIPEKFMKHLQSTKGLYELRIRVIKGELRIFCCFSKDNKIVLLNCFHKKTMKTPQEVLQKALKLMIEFKNDEKEYQGQKGK